MLVLFVSPAAGLGGAERCLLEVVAALRRTAPDVALEVLFLARGPLQARIEQLGVPATELLLPDAVAKIGETHHSAAALLGVLLRGASASRDMLRFAAAFRRHVARLRPDVVHSNGLKAHLLCAALLRRQRVVLHIHDFFGARPLSRWLLHGAERRGVSAIATSRAVRQDLYQVLPNTPTRIVYNAVDTAAFVPGAGDPRWLAELAGLPPPAAGTTSFGMVSTYARWKGHAVFMRAAARLRSQGVPARFYVVGGPIYATEQSQVSREELARLRDELGLTDDLGFVSFQPDTAPVYRALDVAVHPSTKPEPFGLSIVEAMACGRPVIVAKNGGARELFFDGRTALGFETGNDADLALRMRRLANDAELRQRLGAAARADVSERFGPDRMGRQLHDFYRLLAGQAT